jgi:hypothetical protein
MIAVKRPPLSKPGRVVTSPLSLERARNLQMTITLSRLLFSGALAAIASVHADYYRYNRHDTRTNVERYFERLQRSAEFRIDQRTTACPRRVASRSRGAVMTFPCDLKLVACEWMAFRTETKN